MLNPQFLVALRTICDMLIFHHEIESGLRAKILIYIALNRGCTSKEIEYAFDVNQSTISRNVRKLRGRTGGRTKSLRGLVQRSKDSGRAYRYELTEEGERYLRKAILRMSTAASEALMANS